MASAFRLKENATDPSTPTSGELKIYAKTDKVAYVRFDDGSIEVLTGTASVTSLTGDVTGTGPGATATTISAGAVDNSKISASAAIAQSKLAALTANRVNVTDGSGIITASATTATELGYLSGVTSAIQTQIDGKQPLDSDLTALAALSDTGIIARTGSGTVSARTLQAGTGINITNADGVSGDPSISTTITQYTDELAQDAVGGALTDTSTIDFTYNDVGNTISADVIQSGIDHGSISGLADDDHTQYHNDSRALTWLGTRSTSDLPEGSNLYYTDERAQDAVGSALIDTATVDFTYNDAGNTITADVIQSGIDHGSISGLADDDHMQYHTDARALTWLGTRSTSDLPEGSNLYYTDERAQDAVGSILADSSKIDFTYNDAGNSITADIVAGSLVNDDINASAAIAYSKLSLSNSIVNADINSSAAIAFSKMAALTASKAVVSDGSGVITTSSTTSTEIGYVAGVTSAIQTQLDGKMNNRTSQSISSSVSLTTGTADLICFVNTSAARSITFPNPATNSLRRITIKDVTGSCETNNITMVRFGTEKIENTTASKVLSANFGSWIFISDGTDWWLI